MAAIEPYAVGGRRGLARIAGTSRDIQVLRERAAQIAPLDATVLLTGETGTGKSALARALHETSRRRGLPLVSVNCAALAPSLIESELFGHEKGSFTHAIERRAGRFEIVQDGTIFLDEIGDLDLGLQAKLLRVLEDRVFERVGGTRTHRMRARVLAATSRDLQRAMRAGRFRADLYFRVNVFRLVVPPLRTRLEDLDELVERGFEEAAWRLGVAPPEYDRAFVARLAAHPWPGNVRELFNTLERTLVRSRRTGHVDERDLVEVLEEDRGLSPMAEPEPDRGAPPCTRLSDLRERIEGAEREDILRALALSAGNIAAAARRLEIPRSTLRHRMQKHRIQ